MRVEILLMAQNSSDRMVLHAKIVQKLYVVTVHIVQDGFYFLRGYYVRPVSIN